MGLSNSAQNQLSQFSGWIVVEGRKERRALLATSSRLCRSLEARLASDGCAQDNFRSLSTFFSFLGPGHFFPFRFNRASPSRFFCGVHALTRTHTHSHTHAHALSSLSHSNSLITYVSQSPYFLSFSDNRKHSEYFVLFHFRACITNTANLFDF